MFSKSITKNKQRAPLGVASVTFNGYVGVRTEPLDPPPNLKENIQKGADIISIWFQHFHAETFRKLDKNRDIKIVAPVDRQRATLPRLEDMSCREILEFCKSINVHPAHLMPLDDDMDMTLPTPLLELLIDMAHGGEFSKGLGLSEIYLANNAIFYECRRVKQYAKLERREAAQNGDRFSTLAGVFTDVLADAQAKKAISNTTIIAPDSTPAYKAGRGYPYIERVMDIAIFQAERILDVSNDRLDVKRQILRGHIEGFVKSYQKAVHSGWNSEVDARDFLMDILDEIEGRRYHDQDDIKMLVEDRLQGHDPLLRQQEAAQELYANFFMVSTNSLEASGQAFFNQVEEGRFLDLISAVQTVVIAGRGMTKAEKMHEQEEGKYITRTAKIYAAFNEVEDPKLRNLLNNRAVLGMHNIGLDEKRAASLSPK